jgi:hypothetical protein
VKLEIKIVILKNLKNIALSLNLAPKDTTPIYTPPNFPAVTVWPDGKLNSRKT